ncbi:uncharacterized protein LOC119315034 [Triticum dicoccoides]|uniref:uncharacterized protein LOC119315034 n=1 Tax=Triticum dicoccoides TaxID=85692 RepID=UPI001891CFF4|nr:uncharacterized protein LOC119315034 [Triticum dicoccoides]
MHANTCGDSSDRSDAGGGEKKRGNGSGGGGGCEDGELVAIDKGFRMELDELLRSSAYVLGKGGKGIVYKVVVWWWATGRRRWPCGGWAAAPRPQSGTRSSRRRPAPSGACGTPTWCGCAPTTGRPTRSSSSPTSSTTATSPPRCAGGFCKTACADRSSHLAANWRAVIGLGLNHHMRCKLRQRRPHRCPLSKSPARGWS